MSEAADHIVNGGRIIVFSGSVLGKNLPTYGAYIASKSGVEGLTRVLGNELGPRNITVNAVAPGPVAAELFLSGKTKSWLQQLPRWLPSGASAKWAISSASLPSSPGAEGGWINGQIIRVNGGYA
jgi:3-oxoacyl-[acyl-carrier protein] reductase